MNNWISITKKLPTLNEPVLFYYYVKEYKFRDVNLGWYEGQKTSGEAIVMQTSADESSPCTHWMPRS